MRRVALCGFFFLCFITACSTSGSRHCINPIPCTDCSTGCRTGSIEELKALAANPPRGNCEEIGSIRAQALQEEALSLGAQAGLAARAKVMNCQLEKNAKYLSQVFNFQLLLLPCSILPPVLVEGRQTLNLADNTTIRIADRVYSIIQQARFVTAPPHWREYLFLDFTEPEMPNSTLLPKTGAEHRVWTKYLIQGWNDGINQANTIYGDNLARLKRDYTGMIRYRTLLAQRMVTAPFVAKTNLGITCDGSGMHINDQVLRITALPQLCTDSRTWKPAISREMCCP
jgi:defect-in-organelle-trafficking protein DotC